MAGEEFAGLLRELKERSGLSYGTLGKRLHLSASTLHRYVNGEAVPTDYAPVERFARVCGATPDELVELHRWWVRADVLRGQKASSGAGDEGGDLGQGGGSGEAGASREAAVPEPEAVPEAVPEPDAEPAVRPRRRTVFLAGAAVAAAAVCAALVVNLVPGRDDQGGQRSAGAVSSTVTGGSGDTASGRAQHGSPEPSASRGASPAPSVSHSAEAAPGSGSADGATAPTVVIDPYKWEGPCSQHYLVNQKAAQVPPPPNESDARGWVTALGGVAGGEQMLALTVQGTGRATVVLEALHVRVVGKNAPLAWNDFAMGVGCGGGVETKSFAVDLDAGRPVPVTKGGQRDFPYKVSESDPEVFYVFADARAHDVSWYLELDWSSGTKSGTVRIDDTGKPFRTSGNVGRPAYEYPLGSSAWGLDASEPRITG